MKFPHPALRSPAQPVAEFGDELRLLSDDLLDTMRDAPGIGIAAPHVGISSRLVVLEIDRARKPGFYVNPTIEWSSPELVRHEEGSVSMPGVSEEIERPAAIRFRYQDLSGVSRTEEASGLLAVCLQHEIDQLDGVFWIYRLPKLRRDRVVKRYEKLRRAHL